MDTIKVNILDDGTIKVETDTVSQPNHLNCDQFLREMGRLAGGKTEIKMKGAHLHGILEAHCHDGHTHEAGH
jgi:hypothetical protein